MSKKVTVRRNANPTNHKIKSWQEWSTHSAHGVINNSMPSARPAEKSQIPNNWKAMLIPIDYWYLLAAIWSDNYPFLWHECLTIRLLKTTHLLRCAHPTSLRRTVKYASFLIISCALHPDVFDQPGRKLLFQQLIDCECQALLLLSKIFSFAKGKFSITWRCPAITVHTSICPPGIVFHHPGIKVFL